MLTDRHSVIFAALIAATSVSSIAPQITAFTNAAAAASELFSVIDKKSELDPLDESGKMPNDSCNGSIQITNLAFAYPSRPGAPVLRDFNISIPAGKTTALVGASGSGKSTVVGLIERWYAPSSGWDRHFALQHSVAQEPYTAGTAGTLFNFDSDCGLSSDSTVGASPVSRYRFRERM